MKKKLTKRAYPKVTAQSIANRMAGHREGCLCRACKAKRGENLCVVAHEDKKVHFGTELPREILDQFKAFCAREEITVTFGTELALRKIMGIA